MRHQRVMKKFGRSTAHRKMLMKGLVTNLILAESIKTTLPKAKEARKDAATLVTIAQKGDLAARRLAASRTLDYVETLEGMDLDNVAVLGHSRLGKTALFCAANDERFKYSFVNCSGCSGDAITRQKTGEHVVHIYKSFPVWFCPNYAKYRDNEDNMPFDQHFLVACCAPRFICSSTAIEDTWADPFSQFLSDYAASEAWELLGQKGLVTPDRMPVPGDVYTDGSVGFQLRSGAHFLSRADWNFYLDFMEKKMAEGK